MSTYFSNQPDEAPKPASIYPEFVDLAVAYRWTWRLSFDGPCKSPTGFTAVRMHNPTERERAGGVLNRIEVATLGELRDSLTQQHDLEAARRSGALSSEAPSTPNNGAQR